MTKLSPNSIKVNNMKEQFLKKAFITFFQLNQKISSLLYIKYKRKKNLI